MRARRDLAPKQLDVVLERTVLGFPTVPLPGWPPGRAAYQFDRVHSHGLYDVECDTSTSTPQDCAAQITTFLPRSASTRAFDRLRAAYVN